MRLLLAAALLAASALPGCASVDVAPASADDAPAPGGLRVLDAAASPEVIRAGDGTTLRAAVRNDGAGEAAAILEFLLDGEAVGHAAATLLPGETAILDVGAAPRRAGTLLVEARLAGAATGAQATLTVR